MEYSYRILLFLFVKFYIITENVSRETLSENLNFCETDIA